MFRFTTGSEALIRHVYRSRALARLVVFDISRIDGIRSQNVREQILQRQGTEGAHGKTTFAGRFADVDLVAVKYLSTSRPNIIQDVGVSSGITSCDFYDVIARDPRLSAEYYISDKYNLYYADGSMIRRIYDPEGQLLRGSVCGILADPTERFPFVGSRWLFEALRLDLHFRPRDEARTRTVDLFDPRTQQYLREGKLRSIVYDPFVDVEPERFTFVRCMYLLNRGLWFADEQIALGMRNLVASLKPGGVLEIGRSDDVARRNDVTFFRKAGGCLQILEHVNRGTENLDLLRRMGVLAEAEAENDMHA